MTAPLKRAAGLLVYRRLNDRYEYLMLQASYAPHHWTPPKGHVKVEKGEDERTAASRETEEEAGFTVDQLEIDENFKKHEMHYMVKPKPKDTIRSMREKRVTYWLARLKVYQPVVLRPHEHQKYCWAELKKAIELANFPEYEELLRSAEKYLTSS